MALLSQGYPFIAGLDEAGRGCLAGPVVAAAVILPLNEEISALLDGVRDVLKLAGMKMDDLVYVQIFCADLSLFDRFNQRYRTYFEKEFPARAFLGTGPLLLKGRFELQGIAARR